MSVTNEHSLKTKPIVQDYSTNSLTDNEWDLSWSYLPDDEKSGSNPESEISGEEWDASLSECEWDTASNADDSWSVLDEIWDAGTPFTWGDTDGAQIDWDYENQELPEPMPAEPKPVIMIDTLEKLDEFLPVLSQLKDGVELAFDCEGTPSEDENGVPIPGGGFGRNGNISFLSMTIISMNETYVFDVWELKRTAFERESKDGLSLKKVLESHDRIQLWWDVRTDWDTLFHKYGIQIGKVRDVQLMELLSRRGQRSRICGLMRAMREEGGKSMSPAELDDWLSEKEAGGDYFRKHGWRPLTARPINYTARKYIAGDTECLYQLQNRLQDRLSHWAFRMQGKTVVGLIDAIGKRSALQATTGDLMEFIDQQSAIRAHDATSPEFALMSSEEMTLPPPAFRRIEFWAENYDRLVKRRAEELEKEGMLC